MDGRTDRETDGRGATVSATPRDGRITTVLIALSTSDCSVIIAHSDRVVSCPDQK